MSTISAGTTVGTALALSGDTTGALTFQVSGTVTAATITAAGNFGIGTTSPGVLLDVSAAQAPIIRLNNTTAAGTAGNAAYSILNCPSNNSGAFFRAHLATADNGLNYDWGIGNFGTSTKDVLAFYSGGLTERMRITAAGNVGIGTTSPGAKISVSGGSSTFAHINGGNSNTDPIFASVNNTTVASADYGWLWFNNATNGNLDLYRRAGSTTNTHVASFVRASGNMLLGTSTGLGEGARLDIITGDGEADVTTWRYNNAAAGKYWRWAIDSNSRIYLLNQGAAGVYLDDGSTAWAAYSDERAKTDLKPIEDSVNKVCQLRAVTGRFKKDDEGVSRSFLIAQDVKKVFPEAVSDINPDELGVRYTDVIPLLVAAVKELKAENDALKARIEALESK